MWEDNNPLSYERRDSFSSAGASVDPYPNPISPSFQNIDPASPTFQGENLYSDVNKDTETNPNRSEEDDDDDPEDLASRRERGYSSRVEQILHENKDLLIFITDAGKSHEGGGNYIVYTIKTGVSP
jgi:sorting nexin-41/42